ncbi:MAG: hypothetical protein JXB35_01050 [Anaerolineae bacterium]|nr:hypothetical protein [Anaerolineae bacterium]
MNRPRYFRALWLAGVLFVMLLGHAGGVQGFAEEELGFVDRDGTYYPPTGDFPDDRISTVHDDLTLALALSAGFSVTDSHTLRIWNQLVDSEVLPSTPISYTYGNTGFYDPPNPLIACIGANHARQIWPTGRFDPDTASVTSRFGPYSPFFHFPHLGGADLQALHDWAWGKTDILVGYEAYAWGRLNDLTLMRAVQNNGCIITRTVAISMPIPAGSLEAFGTYLHTLGDAYSHDACLRALAEVTPSAPWGTHTVPALGDTSVYACDYNPTNPRNDDAHGREFGGVYSDTQQTIAAALAIYDELSARSIAREGIYWPLPLSTPLIVSDTTTTLEGAIVHFVKDRDYDQPEYRRAYAANLAQAVQAYPRSPIRRIYLPLVLR